MVKRKADEYIEPLEDAKKVLRWRDGVSWKNLRRENDRLKLAEEVLQSAETVYDLEHVEWLVDVCKERGEDLKGIRTEAMRLVHTWAVKLQANLKSDGVPMQEPLRDELIDSAVTFLEDEQVKDRSVDDKIQFLVEKGLNKTEIRIACAQVGLEPPASFTIDENIRKEMVSNGSSFLMADAIKQKPFEERLAFLKSKGLTNAEIIRSCEVAKTERIPTVEDLNSLKEYKAREPREDMIKNGVTFLQHPSVKTKTLREKLEFLRGKGMIPDEMRAACARAKVVVPPDLEQEFLSVSAAASESPIHPVASHSHVNNLTSTHDPDESDEEENVRAEMVQKGVTFLSHPSVKSKPMGEKLGFLREKGLNEAELKEACAKAGGSNVYQPSTSSSGSSFQSEDVQKAISFLKHPSAKSRPTQEKISFLRSKGISNNDIKMAMNIVGLSSNEVYGTTTTITSSNVPGGLKMNLTTAQTDEDEDGQSHKNFSNSTQVEETDLNEILAKEKARKSRIMQAASFLLNKNTTKSSSSAKVAFLRSKGLSVDEIEEAFTKVGLEWSDSFADPIDDPSVDLESSDAKEEETIERAVTFLSSEETASKPLKEKIAFLRSQGMTEQFIEESLKRAGIEATEEDRRDEYREKGIANPRRVDEARVFLEKAQHTGTLSSMTSFLRNKGLSEEEIRLAVAQAGIDLKLLETKPDPTIDKMMVFLNDPSTSGSSVTERVKFFRNKGFDESQILLAFQNFGIKDPIAAIAEEESILHGLLRDRVQPIEQARRFLLSNDALKYNRDQKMSFLIEKGLTDVEIQSAIQLARVAKPSFNIDSPSVEHPNVLQGQKFLLRTSKQGYSLPRQVSFLKTKGLRNEEILQSFQLANIPISLKEIDAVPSELPAESQSGSSSELRETMVNAGARFLSDEKTKTASPVQRIQYLRNKGLTEDEIAKSIEMAALPDNERPSVAMATIREDQVKRGASFLLDPSVQDVALEDRVVYLQNQGLTEQEVLQAAIRAKIDLVPSYISTIPTSKLKKDRWIEPSDLDPTGKCLQGVINCVVDILSEMTASEPDQFTARAMTVLATSLSRCRPAKISPACVAIGCKVIVVVLNKSRLKNGTEIPKADIDSFFQSIAELLARADQIDYYAKDGLKQLQQVNLHFLSISAILQPLLKLWQECPVIEFDQGVALARAVHGSFCSVAGLLPFEAVGSQMVKCVVDHILHQRDSAQDVAVYVAAGLLRGAPDYAWGKDVQKSPQPKIEAAFHKIARSSLLRFEKFAEISTAGSNHAMEKELEHARAAGVVVAVGLASVYADSQISWSSAVLQTVVEGLLGGALWNEECIGIGPSSLDERVESANMFTQSEEFQLAPQLMSLLLSKLPSKSSVSKAEKNSSIRLLNKWVLNRLNRFSNRVFTNCRETTPLCAIIARRTVQLVYGTGDEKESTSTNINEEPIEKENNLSDGQIVNSAPGEGSGLERNSVEENEDEEEEFEDDDLYWEHYNVEVGLVEDQPLEMQARKLPTLSLEEQEERFMRSLTERLEKNRNIKAPVGGANRNDPLFEYLGAHSGLARLFQMSYLCVVLLGSHCVNDAGHDFALQLLDSLANLSAFQVRVKEAIDLENSLQVLIAFPDRKRNEDRTTLSALDVFRLFAPHVHSEDKAATKSGELSPRGDPYYDWALGARIEFLMGFAENWMKRALLLSAQLPAATAVEDTSQEAPGRPYVVLNSSVPASQVLEQADKEEWYRRRKRTSEGLFTAPEFDGIGENGNVETGPATLSERMDHLFVSMAKILLDIGVRHPFAHLNFRSHNWLVEIINSIDEFDEPQGSSSSNFDENETSSALPPPYRLAIIPSYIETSLESHPLSTSTKILSFVVSSTLTALGRDPNEIAQSIAVMVFTRLVDTVDEHISNRARNKKAGSSVATLLFTCLKAISLPALPSALESAADLIKRAPRDDTETTSGSDDLKPDVIRMSRLFSQEWLMDNVFGVISRTEDAHRRLRLATWYLTKIQGLTVGGKL